MRLADHGAQLGVDASRGRPRRAAARANASSVRCASYRAGRSAGPPQPWIRARAGRNSAATASVEAATASPSPGQAAEDELEQQHAARGRPPASVAVSAAVDQRAVDDEVDVVQAPARDGHEEAADERGGRERVEEAADVEEGPQDPGHRRRARPRRRPTRSAVARRRSSPPEADESETSDASPRRAVSSEHREPLIAFERGLHRGSWRSAPRSAAARAAASSRSRTRRGPRRRPGRRPTRPAARPAGRRRPGQHEQEREREHPAGEPGPGREP